MLETERCMSYSGIHLFNTEREFHIEEKTIHLVDLNERSDPVAVCGGPFLAC